MNIASDPSEHHSELQLSIDTNNAKSPRVENPLEFQNNLKGLEEAGRIRNEQPPIQTPITM